MRPHHPWYWAAKNAWFVEIGDTRHRLGQHPDGEPAPNKRKRGDPPPKPPREIEQAYFRLMATDPASLPKASELKVCQVCDLFLDYPEKHHTEDTYRGYKDFLQDFCELYGTLLARDLKPLHVTRWLDAHPGWNGSRRNAVVAVKRAFNWADAEGVLQPNPVKSVKKPPQRHRDRVLTPEERQEILRTIPESSTASGRISFQRATHDTAASSPSRRASFSGSCRSKKSSSRPVPWPHVLFRTSTGACRAFCDSVAPPLGRVEVAGQLRVR